MSKLVSNLITTVSILTVIQEKAIGRMSEPQKPGWQSATQSLGSLVMMAAFGGAMAFMIWLRLIPPYVGAIVGLGLFCLMFVVLTAALYVVWTWFFFEHPAEIRKKLPISSKELRRKQKQYFDKLPK